MLYRDKPWIAEAIRSPEWDLHEVEESGQLRYSLESMNWKFAQNTQALLTESKFRSEYGGDRQVVLTAAFTGSPVTK